MQIDTVRVDQWLWSVRLFRTRSDAAAACRAGHVRVNGKLVKPAAPVRVGDTIVARVGERQREVEATRLLTKRVGAAVAGECYVDHSPPPPPRESSTPVFERPRGAGRPTKRDRRKLDELRGRRS